MTLRLDRLLLGCGADRHFRPKEFGLPPEQVDIEDRADFGHLLTTTGFEAVVGVDFGSVEADGIHALVAGNENGTAIVKLLCCKQEFDHPSLHVMPRTSLHSLHFALTRHGAQGPEFGLELRK